MRRLGVRFDLKPSHTIKPNNDYDVAIFYGLAQGLRAIFDRQKKCGKAIYIDLGYWGRRNRTRYDGFHKVVLNDRHPTAYFQNRIHDGARFDRHNVEIRPWRESGKNILLAGMSNKAAAQEGFAPNQWERETIKQIRRFTDRPIVYRPKPNWLAARPLQGTSWGKDQTLENALSNCHVVVAHHSNVAVDALLYGVPCICPSGVASVLSAHNLKDIENPPMPDGREQWAADLAWTQWSIQEMVDGLAYRYLADEGLV